MSDTLFVTYNNPYYYVADIYHDVSRDTIPIHVSTSILPERPGVVPGAFNVSVNQLASSVRFGVSLMQDGEFDVNVYNISGQRIWQYNGHKSQPGYYHVNWDHARISNGLYFVQLRQGEKVVRKRFLIVR